MKISMDIIASDMADVISEKNLLPDTDLSIYSVRYLVANETEFLDVYVYLCAAEELPPPQAVPRGGNIICVGRPKGFSMEDYRHCNLLILEGNCRLRHTCNYILNLKEQYTLWELTLLRFVEEDAPLQRFLDESFPILHNPMVLLDTHYNTLAITDFPMKDAPLWQALQSGYGYKYADMINACDIDIPAMVDQAEMVQRLNNIDHRYILYAPLCVHSHPAAGISLHKIKDPQEPFPKNVFQLLGFFVSILNKKMQKNTYYNHSRSLLYEKFISDILDGRLENPDAINEEQNFIPISSGDYLILALIGSKISLEYVADYLNSVASLERMLTGAKCIVYKSNIVVILNMKGQKKIRDDNISHLSRWLQQNEAVCAFSTWCHTLAELRARYDQAVTAYCFGREKNPNSLMHFYHSCVYQHVIAAASREIDFSSLRHPALEKLGEFDEINHTEYLQTLKVYLRNERNISDTAQEMHLHRNTIQYRINRIEDITNLTFDSWELRKQLSILLDCMEFLESEGNGVSRGEGVKSGAVKKLRRKTA